MFEITWLVVHVEENVITLNQAEEKELFANISGKDLTFLGNDVVRIQWSAGPESNFIQKKVKLEDGTEEIRDFPLEKLADIPNYNQLHKLIFDALKEEIIPEPTLAEKLAVVRSFRLELLQEADITILRHLENGETIPPEWLKYRQDLRDIPSEIESGNLPQPTAVNIGSEYFPNWEVQFNSWPVKP